MGVSLAGTATKLALDGGPPVRDRPLPFDRPELGEEEIQAVAEVLRSGQVVGDGPRGKAFEKALASCLETRHAFFVTSCTAALELSLMALEVGPGDEVICPSFTFASTANAIVLRGARPVFVDIDPATYNIDPACVAQAITPKCRAIIPVHYAGMACPMDELQTLADQHELALVEDAAQAIDARYKGQYLGTFGNTGCLSFHGTKNLACGEGGALLTNDDDLARRIEIIREKGTNRAAFYRGEVDKYTWVMAGSSYVQSDLMAAILLVQLDKLAQITQARRAHAAYLLAHLQPLGERIQLPAVPPGAEPNWHIFAIRVPAARRDWAIQALRAEGIACAFHYVPLHTSPFAVGKLGCQPGSLPVTEAVSDTLIRLPIYPSLKEQDLHDIVLALEKIYPFL